MLHHYTFLEKIGSGACCEGVWKVREECSNKNYAIKVVKKDEVFTPQILREITMLKSLENENILKYKDWYTVGENCIHLVAEYCDGGSLKNYVQERSTKGQFLSEAEAANIVYQIAVALKYLHERNICHRDLKLANVLLKSPGIIKVADFGLAEQLQSQSCKVLSPGGTFQYLPPEALSNKGQGLKGDIWALAVILYWLLTGQYAFQSDYSKETLNKIRNGNYNPLNDSISCVAQDLLSKMLQVDEEERLSPEEVLLHPFLQSVNKGVVNEHYISVKSLGGVTDVDTTSNVSLNEYGDLTLFQERAKELFILHSDGWHVSLWKNDICYYKKMIINFAPLKLQNYFKCSQMILRKLLERKILFEMKLNNISCIIMKNVPNPNIWFVNYDTKILFCNDQSTFYTVQQKEIEFRKVNSNWFRSCVLYAMNGYVSDSGFNVNEFAMKKDFPGSLVLSLNEIENLWWILQETLSSCPFLDSLY